MKSVTSNCTHSLELFPDSVCLRRWTWNFFESPRPPKSASLVFGPAPFILECWTIKMFANPFFFHSVWAWNVFSAGILLFNQLEPIILNWSIKCKNFDLLFSLVEMNKLWRENSKHFLWNILPWNKIPVEVIWHNLSLLLSLMVSLPCPRSHFPCFRTIKCYVCSHLQEFDSILCTLNSISFWAKLSYGRFNCNWIIPAFW